MAPNKSYNSLDVSLLNQTNPLRTLFRDWHAVGVYCLKVADIMAISACGFFAYLVRFDAINISNLGIPLLYIYAIVAGAFLAVACFNELGVYRVWRLGAGTAMYGRLILGWVLTLLLLASISFLSKTGLSFSRLWFAYWAASGLVAIILIRILAKFLLVLLHRSGWGVRRIAILGPSSRVLSVLARLQQAPWPGLQVALLATSDIPPNTFKGIDIPTVPLAELTQHLNSAPIQEVWLTWPMRDEKDIQSILAELENHTVNIRWIPDIFAYRIINHGITEFAGMPMLDLSISPINGISRLIKEVEDKVLATLILILISPVMLFCAIGVKLSSPGPVLFKQLRHGWDGKEIEVWKFRSMHIHTEENGRVTQATKNDKRTTRFGQFLRRTSLDELPQFFNVLQGRMSIVGPRPHALAHNEQYQQLIRRYPLRHRVKPGITGWAQVNGLRGETDTIEKMRARIEYDLYYIEHWSVWFDLRIIWRTATTVLFDRNAY